MIRLAGIAVIVTLTDVLTKEVEMLLAGHENSNGSDPNPVCSLTSPAKRPCIKICALWP